MNAATGAPITVLIADDQKVVRDGLSLILGMIDELRVIGTAVDGDDAVRQALRDSPDVVLMDLHMPGCDGVSATARILQDRPATRVVVLTTYTDDAWVFRALQAGARGYLTKDSDADQIRDAILTVARGQAQLDPSVQRRLLDAIADALEVPQEPVTDGRDAGVGVPELAILTTRELEVLSHIARGASNAEIAAALYVSAATVKTHVNHLLAKTGCRDRSQLVVLAFRSGLAG